MPPVTDQQLAVLSPYVEGSRPDDRGEMDMYCPLHPDGAKSASLNLQMGAWYCHAGCGGGSVRALLDQEETFVPMEGRAHAEIITVDALAATPVNAVFKTQAELKADIDKWYYRLMQEPKRIRFLYELRGIELWTIKKARIGFDGRHFKIPVYSPDRDVWNIRTYDPEPAPGRSKIWSLRGFGRGRLYPAGILDRLETGDTVLFCEGEWDALLALQSGIPAVTRTDGAGKPWPANWDVAFAGLRVFVCHDRDWQGKKGDRIVTGALRDVADRLYQCQLPYRLRRKHGRDITDYLLDADEPNAALIQLMKNAKEITDVKTDRNSRFRSGGPDRGGHPRTAIQGT